MKLPIRRRLLVGMTLALYMVAGLCAQEFDAPSASGYVPGQYIIELQGPQLGRASRLSSAVARERRTAIAAEQVTFARAAAQRGVRVAGSMRNVMNAVFAKTDSMTEAELTRLPGVKKVYRVPVIQRASVDAPMQLNGVLDGWARAGGSDQAGAGVKIGIVDSGIDPNHPAFRDDSLPVPPGFPRANSAANLALTSRKVIVARSYKALNVAFGGQERGEDTIVDLLGHGTSVAAIAAGVAHQSAAGMLSGVAPKAWLGIYSIGDGGVSLYQALDDVLDDGMDILNLSWGTLVPGSPTNDVLHNLVARLAEQGLLVVMAAGNGGPARRTLSTASVHPHVISVGATPSSSVIAGSVSAGGGAVIEAFPMRTPHPDRMEGALFDLRGLDTAATACRAYPADSLRDRIVLTAAGGCTNEIKLNNLMAAGAKAMLQYLTAPGGAGRAAAGAATLPAVLVTQADGQALLSRLTAQNDLRAVIVFDGVAHPRSAAGVSAFSSRGPTFLGAIKPDLVAVGQHFTATQRVSPGSGTFAPSGYIGVNATSFSSPMVAGAAAVLKAARPTLTMHQLRSLLINTARVVLNDSGVVAVQEAGAGGLNLNAALEATVALSPTSMGLDMSQFRSGFGVFPLTLTNLTDKPETYRIEAVHFGGRLRMSLNPVWVWPFPNQTAISVTVAGRQSRTVQLLVEAEGVEVGEHQGFVQVTGSQTGLSYNVPYWLGVGDNVPGTARYFGWVGRDGGAEGNHPNQEVFLFFEVGDRFGIPVARDSLNFRGSVVSGGGEVLGLDNSVLDYSDHTVVRVRLGPQPGNNVFRIEFGRISGTVGVPAVPRP